ncbi:MAG: hypothetical protein LC754_18495 [Acidobacteria bacterium]|nr:hypothetical protein [Acidobacteriota bacterium]
MSNLRWTKFATLALACLFLAGAQSIASAQGRSGGGRGQGGPPAGVGHAGGSGGVDRGLGTSSSSSNGRADNGRGIASDNSNGRSDAGLDHARMARDNAQHADRELREHPGIADGLRVNANDLRAGYQTALATNPDLKFGQYVAATRIGANLHARNSNITTAAILAGLAQGHSIGRTLQDLGLSSREARDAEREANRQLKEMKKHRS